MSPAACGSADTASCSRLSSRSSRWALACLVAGALARAVVGGASPAHGWHGSRRHPAGVPRRLPQRSGALRARRGRLVVPRRHRQGRERPRAVDRAGRPLRPELPRLLRRADADPQRLRLRRRHVGPVQGRRRRRRPRSTSTTPTTRSPPPRATCAPLARPRDWRAALFAYNHAGWYVDDVVDAGRRRTGAQPSAAARARIARRPARRGSPPFPGFPGERCDARIVADVVVLARAYGLRVTDCFGGAPHAARRRASARPRDRRSRPSTATGAGPRRLARAAGWTPACAASGCPGRGPFRVVLYNGYPGHGDPRHTRPPASSPLVAARAGRAVLARALGPHRPRSRDRSCAMSVATSRLHRTRDDVRREVSRC